MALEECSWLFFCLFKRLCLTAPFGTHLFAAINDFTFTLVLFNCRDIGMTSLFLSRRSLDVSGRSEMFCMDIVAERILLLTKGGAVVSLLWTGLWRGSSGKTRCLLGYRMRFPDII